MFMVLITLMQQLLCSTMGMAYLCYRWLIKPPQMFLVVLF
jgi:hypothetical protein